MRRLFGFMGFMIGSAFIAAGPAFSEVAPPAALPAAGEVKIEPEYTYQGDHFRDPFVPLAGQGAMELPPMSQEDQVFKASDVEIKGIIGSRTGRMALLRSNSGGIFVVKDGKIFDSKRKTVKGFVGIVKEKSLVIIGPNNQVTELKLKTESDGKTSAAR